MFSPLRPQMHETYRLQSTAEANTVVIAESTRKLLGNLFDARMPARAVTRDNEAIVVRECRVSCWLSAAAGTPP